MASRTMLQNVEKHYDAKTLIVTWTGGEKQVYPYVWLRENCQCRTVCWHDSGLLPRTDSKYKVDVEVAPKTLEVTGSLIEVEWSDGHKSQYLSSWLKQYRFDNSEQDTTFDPPLRYWGSDVEEKQLKKFDFNDILTSDEVLLDWLLELKELGIALLVGAPKKAGQLYRIGERVSFLRTSNFGDIFKVQTRYDADGGSYSNAAYQNGFLSLHTDLTYYQRPPGILMLHCIQQVCEGGESLLADSFKAAEAIKEEKPRDFDLLTSSIFENRHDGDDYYGKYCQLARHPIIKLNSRGQVYRIVLGDHSRHAMLRIPVSNVLPTYRALKAFRDKLYDPANLFKYKLKEGDVICINNYRVIHGREEFKVSDTMDRHLEGAYLEWDQVNSRIRILQEQCSKK